MSEDIMVRLRSQFQGELKTIAVWTPAGMFLGSVGDPERLARYLSDLMRESPGDFSEQAGSGVLDKLQPSDEEFWMVDVVWVTEMFWFPIVSVLFDDILVWALATHFRHLRESADHGMK